MGAGRIGIGALTSTPRSGASLLPAPQAAKAGLTEGAKRSGTERDGWLPRAILS